MKYPEIEAKARDLQKKIWEQRARLWPVQVPSLLEMLDPAIAARVLNVQFEIYEELGRFGSGRDHYEIAGMIDRQARRIAVSKKFQPAAMRFTGAHEVGHWLLHPREVMHRDRPIEGFADETLPRPPLEREADYFAACFLVPRKLAMATFKATFQVNAPLFLDDASAFWLSHGDPGSLLGAETGSLDFARAVASATSYGGQHFKSLASQFGVSVTTMAIRLRELELIRE